MARKIAPLEELARNLIGDGKEPNIYFVTDRGTVVTVTRNRETAVAHWRTLAQRRPLIECALEDRVWGTISSVEPETDTPNAKLRVYA